MTRPVPYWLALALVLVAPLVLLGCSTFRSSDDELLERLSEAPSEPEIVYANVQGWRLRALRAGSPDAPRVLMIHGAPGSLDDFERYFSRTELLERAELVSIDRPGYGYSEHGRIETSVREQARLLEPFLVPGTIAVGHSYGGTLAARIAMEYPDDISGLVLVAASVSPEDELIFFFNAPFEWPVFNWTLSPDWRVANAEKVTRVAELREMEPLWPRIRVPTVVVHGTDDFLVPYEHALYAMERLTNAPAELVTLEEESHFVIWSREELISDIILRMLESVDTDQ
ncbi:MAG: alpha/beta fold hydrolase [Spirochaetota bacterium]